MQGLPEDLTAAVPRTEAGRLGLAALLARPERALVALDYDGTLAPIVADPAQARPLPETPAVLGRVASAFGGLAIVTGRPAAVAAELGGFATAPGLDRLVVLGRYGAERWERGSPPVPRAQHAGVQAARAELFGIVDSVRARAGPSAEGMTVEDKGLALAVHTRRARDPAAALAALREPLGALAVRHGLLVEPGRYVLELRPPGADKGTALLRLARELDASAVLYAGDDLGDLAAFDALDLLRAGGVEGLSVAVASAETSAPQARADLVVAGPAGLLALLDALSDLVR